MKSTIINTVIFILLGSFFTSVKAQQSTLIKGYVKSDSLYLKNIHIINESSNLLVLSDNDGFFEIKVKKGDVILFSSVSYLNRKISITDTHIESQSIMVYLEPEVNELGEVTLDNITLNYDISDLRKKNYEADYSKAPDIRSSTDPTYAPGTAGVDLIEIISSLIVRPILKNYNKRKRERAQISAEKQIFINQIRDIYGDDFFINILRIPSEKINLFIEYCEENGLKEFYKKSELEVVDFFVKKAEEYRNL